MGVVRVYKLAHLCTMRILNHGQCRRIVGFDGDGMISHRLGVDEKPFKDRGILHHRLNCDTFCFFRAHGTNVLLFGFPEQWRSVIGDNDSSYGMAVRWFSTNSGVDIVVEKAQCGQSLVRCRELDAVVVFVNTVAYDSFTVLQILTAGWCIAGRSMPAKKERSARGLSAMYRT